MILLPPNTIKQLMQSIQFKWLPTIHLRLKWYKRTFTYWNTNTKWHNSVYHSFTSGKLKTMKRHDAWNFNADMFTSLKEQVQKPQNHSSVLIPFEWTIRRPRRRCVISSFVKKIMTSEKWNGEKILMLTNDFWLIKIVNHHNGYPFW